MRISEDSAQRLVVQDQSTWITALCFIAAAFILIVPVIAGEGFVNIWLALLLVGFGLAFLRSSTAEFDKATQVCTFSKRTVIKRSRIRIPFSDIRDVKLEVEPLNSSAQQPNYQLSLATPSGMIPLSDAYEPNQDRQDQIRKAILEAVGRQELLEHQADPVRALVEQGRIVDAVALLRKRDHLDLTTARQRVAEMQNAGRPS